MKWLFFLSVFIPTIVCALDETIIFHYLPKNGESSVTSLLDQQFLPNQIFPQTSFRDLKNMKSARKCAFIRGHFFFNQLKSLKAKRITFLHEPVAHVLSEHRFWLANNSHTALSFHPAEDPIEMMQNYQCLFLSSYERTDRSVSMEKHLQSAKQNIEKFFFVGINEDLEQALRALYVLMGWRPASIVPRLNAPEKNDSYPPEVIKAIKKRNWADIQLYAHAKKLYAKKLSRIQKSLVIKPKNGSRNVLS